MYGSFIGDVLARTTDNMIPLVAAITRALEYRGVREERGERGGRRGRRREKRGVEEKGLKCDRN